MRLILVIATVWAICPNGITFRKEQSDMTQSDWSVYSATIQRAITLGIWEKAAEFHDNLSIPIHNHGPFLFWHRKFTRDVELKLQQIDPRFFFPYFDTARVYNSWATQPIIAVSHINCTRGLQTQNLNWPKEKWADLYQSSIAKDGMQTYANDGELLHGTFHLNIGGDMITMKSPRDPLFYSHHGFVDYEWSKAQLEWAKRGLGMYSSSPIDQTNNHTVTGDDPLPGYEYLKLKDLLNVSDFCYEYLYPGQLQATNTVSNINSAKTTAYPPLSTSMLIAGKAFGTQTSQLTPLLQSVVTISPSLINMITATATISIPQQNTAAAKIFNTATSLGSSLGKPIALSLNPKLLRIDKDEHSLIKLTSIPPIASPPSSVVITSTRTIATNFESPTSTITRIIHTSAPKIVVNQSLFKEILPGSYQPPTKCPQQLPPFWLAMNNMNQSRAINLQKSCLKLIDDVKGGYTPHSAPVYTAKDLTAFVPINSTRILKVANIIDLNVPVQKADDIGNIAITNYGTDVESKGKIIDGDNNSSMNPIVSSAIVSRASMIFWLALCS